MDTQIGFYLDRPKYKRTLSCLLGLHKSSRYVIVRGADGIDYFVCKQCGKRYKILPWG